MSRKPRGETGDETRQGESFVARWARLKRQDTADEHAASATAPAELKEPLDSAAVDDCGDQTGVDGQVDAPLPSVDDLKPDSDITAFLNKRVPEELRRLAMRRMWTLDPAIRDFIEMAENQYDWNDPNGVPGFGALPAGSDMNALLAQATGMWKPEPKDQRDDDRPPAAVADASDAMDGCDVRHTEDANANDMDADRIANDPSSVRLTEDGAAAANVDAGTERSGAATDPDCAAAAEKSAALRADTIVSSAEYAASQPRRRHGGALPS